MNTYWISFSSNNTNLGGCIVDADTPEDAATKTTSLGINPGGQILVFKLEPNAPDLRFWPKDTLISREELLEKGYQKLETKDLPDHGATVICEECNQEEE